MKRIIILILLFTSGFCVSASDYDKSQCQAWSDEITAWGFVVDWMELDQVFSETEQIKFEAISVDRKDFLAQSKAFKHRCHSLLSSLPNSLPNSCQSLGITPPRISQNQLSQQLNECISYIDKAQGKLEPNSNLSKIKQSSQLFYSDEEIRKRINRIEGTNSEIGVIDSIKQIEKYVPLLSEATNDLYSEASWQYYLTEELPQSSITRDTAIQVFGVLFSNNQEVEKIVNLCERDSDHKLCEFYKEALDSYLSLMKRITGMTFSSLEQAPSMLSALEVRRRVIEYNLQQFDPEEFQLFEDEITAITSHLETQGELARSVLEIAKETQTDPLFRLPVTFQELEERVRDRFVSNSSIGMSFAIDSDDRTYQVSRVNNNEVLLLSVRSPEGSMPILISTPQYILEGDYPFRVGLAYIYKGVARYKNSEGEYRQAISLSVVK